MLDIFGFFVYSTSGRTDYVDELYVRSTDVETAKRIAESTREARGRKEITSYCIAHHTSKS